MTNDKSEKKKLWQETLNYLGKSGHKLPTTRRDLLAHGFWSFGAFAAMPSWLSLFASEAKADCGAAQMTTGLPFMTFDMAGGASLPGNFLVGKQGGSKDYLASYDRLGWNPMASGALNEEFGLPMSANSSMILKGILNTCSADARRNLRMGALCHAALDDTNTNQLNAASLVLRAENRGVYISNGASSMNSISGGNSQTADGDPTLKPNFIRSVDDLLSSTNFGGSAFRGMSPNAIRAVAEYAGKLASLQVGRYAEASNGPMLGELSKCAYDKNLVFLNGASGLDPRKDASAQTAYAITANSGSSELNVITASLAMNTIKRNCGPSVWTLGDCDYHTGEQTKGDRQDLAMGEQIGRAINLANLLRQPFFFQLITDGGCDANPGTRNWRGDSGGKCMTVIGCYKPTGAPAQIRTQVGYYTDGQGAERATLIGSDPQKAAYAVFANYLAARGEVGRFHEFLPNVFTEPGQLDSVLIFENRSL